MAVCLELLPKAWQTIIKDGGHGNLMDQSALRSNPDIVEVNRVLSEYHSPNGSETVVLFDAQVENRCWRAFQHVGGNKVSYLTVNPECDPFQTKAPRKPTLADILEWNTRPEEGREADEYVEKRFAKREEEKRRDIEALEEAARVVADEAIVAHEEGKFSDKLTTGWVGDVEEVECDQTSNQSEDEEDGAEEATVPLANRFHAALKERGWLDDLGKAGREFGVMASTVDRWLADGIPASRVEAVEEFCG